MCPLPTKLNNILPRLLNALLKRPVNKSPPPIRPIRGSKEHIPMPTLQFILILAHILWTEEAWSALRVDICVPVVEDLQDNQIVVKDWISYEQA